MNLVINKKIEFIELGLVDYQVAWDRQEALLAENVAIKIANRNLPETAQVPTNNYLIFCEHPHVYTLGKSGKEEHLLLDTHQLEAAEAQYFKTNRGGDITYHGPGQLVGYPILDLENFFTDIHQYMRFLEEAIIQTCTHFGIKAGRIAGLTGVWLDFEGGLNPRKICAMGVKTSRWITMHGFALNVNTDLAYFNNIVPCGIDDKAVTSIGRELNHIVGMEEVKQVLFNKLAELFGFEI
ncbi:MAG: lipoyl(octanoyl) transferase LipB [Bacteroidota bacterium]